PLENGWSIRRNRIAGRPCPISGPLLLTPPRAGATFHRCASVDYYSFRQTRRARSGDFRRGIMATFSSRLALGVAFAAVLAGHGTAQNATGWSASNFNESANRYSPLDQLTAANVATLQPAWRFHLKPAGYTGALKTDEAIPVVIGNTMY